MVEREKQLLELIRNGKHPDTLLKIALDSITFCQQHSEPYQSPDPAAPVSAFGTGQ